MAKTTYREKHAIGPIYRYFKFIKDSPKTYHVYVPKYIKLKDDKIYTIKGFSSELIKKHFLNTWHFTISYRPQFLYYSKYNTTCLKLKTGNQIKTITNLDLTRNYCYAPEEYYDKSCIVVRFD